MIFNQKMQYKYQLVFLGSHNSFASNIVKNFKARLKELGVLQNIVSYIDAKNFHKYQSNLPTVGIYFGDVNGIFKDVGKLSILLNESNIVLPVVSNINRYTRHTPKILHP